MPPYQEQHIQQNSEFSPQTSDQSQLLTPHKTNHLAIWLVITNTIYFASPMLIGLILLLAISTGTLSSGLESAFAVLIPLILYAAFVGIIGIAAAVLDIIYIIKNKPTGLKKFGVIASLILIALSSIGGPFVSLFLNI